MLAPAVAHLDAHRAMRTDAQTFAGRDDQPVVEQLLQDVVVVAGDHFSNSPSH
jgi:hypothetical protein